MTAILDDVTSRKKAEPTAKQRAAQERRQAREQGLALTGPNGLQKQLAKTVPEAALNEEMIEHLGHEKHGRPVPETGKVRNGIRAKSRVAGAADCIPGCSLGTMMACLRRLSDSRWRMRTKSGWLVWWSTSVAVTDRRTCGRRCL